MRVEPLEPSSISQVLRKRVIRYVNKRITKICPKHGEYEHVEERSGYFRCKRCRNDGVIARRRQVKEQLIRDAGGKCSRCGYNKCVGALEFHHVEPEKKEYAISTSGKTLGYKTMKKEAEKCVLLCANCHREVEYGG